MEPFVLDAKQGRVALRGLAEQPPSGGDVCRLELGLEFTDETTFVSVSGEVGPTTKDDFRRILASALDGGVPNVVLDLGDLRFLGIAGYHVLRDAVAEAGRRGVRVRVGPDRFAHLEVTGPLAG